MPNDLVTLKALCAELNATLAGGKIEKIYQPEKDEITLAIRAFGQKHNLVISANAQNPRLHLTTIKKENPVTAPSFCMHLRKYLTSGIIESIEIFGNDRIVNITIISKTELKDTIKLHLIAEMMGRYSNILLLNDKMVISDAIKQASFDAATKRCVLPTCKYQLPEQNKLQSNDKSGIYNYLNAYNGGDLAKYLCSGISGLSLMTAEEIIAHSKIDTNIIPLNVELITDSIETFFNIYNSNLYSPCCSVEKDNNCLDYFVCKYKSQQLIYKKFDTLSEAIQALTQKKDFDERHREKCKHLINAIKKYRNRNQKKLQKANEKLNECDKMEEYKKFGELITSNLYKVKKGDTILQCVDYYSEDMQTINIPLNPQYSPSKIAQDYFKKYNKLKRTLDIIVKQIDETNEDLKYIDTIEQTLKNCNLSADLYQIEQELFTIGAIKKMKTKIAKSAKEGSPIIYDYNGYIIAVGKNNYQNDKLTFKTANGGDVWLHTLNYHGSHTIIFTDGTTPPDDVITFAAEVAAFYSSGTSADKVAVDYTLKKYVKRNPNGKLGMVTYTNQKTAYVKPCEHIESKKHTN